MNYRLLGGAEDDIDRILLRSAREWGFEAAARYDRLIRAVFSAVAAFPALPGSQEIAGARVYSLRFGRRLVPAEQRVGHATLWCTVSVRTVWWKSLASRMIACC